MENFFISQSSELSKILKNIFKKALAFSSKLCYNITRCKYCNSYTEKYSSGERADRRRWRMKEGERVAAVKIWRSEQRATNFGHRNRVEEATPTR